MAKLLALDVDHLDGRIWSIKALFCGLPADTLVELQVLRLGASLGTTVAKEVVLETGYVLFQTNPTIPFYNLNDPLVLRVTSSQDESGEKFSERPPLEIHYIRPHLFTGLRKMLWWLNPVHWFWCLDDRHYVNWRLSELD